MPEATGMSTASTDTGAQMSTEAPTAPQTDAQPVSSVTQPITPPPVQTSPVQAQIQEPPAPTQVQSQVQDSPATSNPISYQPFNIPEGFTAPSESFKQMAANNGLSQVQAQALVDYYCKELIPARHEAIKNQVGEWKKQTMATMGKIGMNMANKVLDTIAQNNPLFKPLLVESGLIHHPIVVKALVDLATHTMGEGTPTSYNTDTPQSKQNLASMMFPNSLKR